MYTKRIINSILGVISAIYLALGFNFKNGVISGSWLEKSLSLTPQDGFLKFVFLGHVLNVFAVLFCLYFIAELIGLLKLIKHITPHFRWVCLGIFIFATLSLTIYIGTSTLSFNNVDFWEGVLVVLCWIFSFLLSATAVFYGMLPITLTATEPFSEPDSDFAILIWLKDSYFFMFIATAIIGVLKYFDYSGWATTVGVISVLLFFSAILSRIIPEKEVKSKAVLQKKPQKYSVTVETTVVTITKK